MKTPEKVVTDFMKAWRKKDFEKMKRYCQKTWIEESKISLSEMLKSFELRSWKILKTVGVGETCRDVNLNLTLERNGKWIKMSALCKVTARTICEVAPYEPDLSGEWGVNPVSLLRGLN